eukprot:1003594_1
MNHGYSLLKIYETNGELSAFHQCTKHYLFVRETELIDYCQVYYNHATHQVYIHQPLFPKSLATQIHLNKNIFRDDERAVKLVASDILNKIWIIHNCGYIHGNITPYNVVKREFDFSNYNPYIKDGWKLVQLDEIKKYKSKGVYVGTPGWTAPEMNLASKKNKYVFPCDIWSFGLVILFALFGEQPLDITDEDRIKYGQKNIIFDKDDKKAMEFKGHLEKKMYSDWYEHKLLQSEKMEFKGHLEKKKKRKSTLIKTINTKYRVMP